MRKTLSILCMVLVMCLLAFTVVMAQDKKPATPGETVVAPTEKEKAEFAKKVNVFYQVVSYGETQKDPLVLLGAIKLLDDLPFSGIAKPGQDGKSGARYDRASLLAEARTFAAGDDDLLAVIAKVETPPEKTEVRGHGGPHGYYHGYYERHHHHRHYGCVWFEVCRHGRCDWVCR